MKFVWAGDRERRNTRLSFELSIDKKVDTLTLYGVDFYNVYVDGVFTSYGPERTAAGYARTRKINIKGAKHIRIIVTCYNKAVFSHDMQPPFFGAECTKKGEVVYTTTDFECRDYEYNRYDMPDYSLQRGFVEGYDFRKTGYKVLETYEVDAPTVLDGLGDTADYHLEYFNYISEKTFEGIDDHPKLWWENKPTHAPRDGIFNPHKDFVEYAIGHKETDYVLDEEHTGFIKLCVDAKEDTEVFVVFEEYLPGGEEEYVDENGFVTKLNGKWKFRRSNCSDIVVLNFPKGVTTFITNEPYAFKYLKIVSKGDANIVPFLVTLENSQTDCVKVSGNEKFKAVFEAARNSYNPNAVDLFTDCPGRERAGWLCDTYFTARAERLFTGTNRMEKNYLENHIIGYSDEIDTRMLMMAFPSQTDGGYIANWAMWFVYELKEYLDRTGDRVLVERAKEKVYNLLDYFKGYYNEYGLIEDLDNWVFVEWSICNDKEHTCGVNYPSNMLYAKVLECVHEMYGDEEALSHAKKMRKAIKELGWNGKYFVDNSCRDENNKLFRREENVTETCQYYALYLGFDMGGDYSKRIIEEFGPLRPEDRYPEIGRSNMFIGNYLRFFYLADVGEYDRVITECLEYFKKMEERTGTLWELDSPTASCCHGFTSVAAEILLRCAIGYKTVKGGKMILDPDFKPQKDYGVKVKYKYHYKD